MRSTGSHGQGPLALNWTDGQLDVSPQLQQRLLAEVQQGICESQEAAALQWLVSRFQSLFLKRLHVWCEKHRERIEACYVLCPLSGEQIKVLMVRRSPKFDFALSDSIADLETVFQQADWPCDILQAAPDSPGELQALFDAHGSINVYGNSAATRSES